MVEKNTWKKVDNICILAHCQAQRGFTSFP